MNVKSLDHIVFIVKSLEEAGADWEAALGLTVEQRLEPEGLGVLGLTPVGEPDAGSAFIELAQPAGSEGRVAELLAERGEGMLSISIEVDDIDAAVAELKSKGVEVAAAVAGPLPETRIARIPADAAHGVPVQLIERAS